MHLKTILIFCSVSFFTGTMSEGLNAPQIQCYNALVKDLSFNSIERVNKVLKYFGIKEKYNFNCTDDSFIKATDILNFVVQYNKLGDDKNMEKLSKEEVKQISTDFQKICDRNGIVMDSNKYEEVIVIIYHYVGSVEKLNEEEIKQISTKVRKLSDSNGVIDFSQNRKLMNIMDNFFKSVKMQDGWKDQIYSQYYFDLSLVLLHILQFRAQINNTVFGKVENVDCFVKSIRFILSDSHPDTINAQYSWIR
ncbi:uncharacterized protein LOC126906131 isoform X2 [Daktulosphaira vitifoliae]|uniref:uncharacterized protein LOC126906131 isoform X2 n=1 Tax=Daktulosphaira vitifoliae TaxID=58002 RepID=UPI0021A9C397|nr:uncharacterized protein LOC126906131 isoform X2 [Daktulosphaira vitifoliae]